MHVLREDLLPPRPPVLDTPDAAVQELHFKPLGAFGKTFSSWLTSSYHFDMGNYCTDFELNGILFSVTVAVFTQHG